MAERSDQRTRSVEDNRMDGSELDESPLDESFGADVEAGPDDRHAAEAASTTGRLRDRLRPSVGGFFSVRTFLTLFVLTAAAMLFAGAVLPLGGIGGLFGIAAGAFGAGVLSDRRRYLESALAGAGSAGLGWLLGNLMITALGFGIPIVAVGAGAGALVAVAGHYFGRDLRDGLTRDI